jgi:hypothetical protein
MAGAVFRAFEDDTVEIIEAAVQVLLGLGAAAFGVALALGPLEGGTGGLVLLVMPGLAGVGWAAWSARALWSAVRRVRALRSAVDGTAAILALRPSDSWADEWQVRRFVDLELLVTLPAVPGRRMRHRVALTDAEVAGLEVGDEVAVRAHPVHPYVRLAGPR